MRVLHMYRYAWEDSRGGIELCIRNLCEGLLGRCESTVLTSSRGWNFERVKKPWGEIVKLPRLPEWKSLTVSPGLPFHLRKIPCDIVHFHSPHPAGALAYLTSPPRAKLVVSHHRDILKFPLLAPSFSFLMRMILEKADAIVAGSDAYLQSSRALNGLAQKTEIIPYGLDEDSFRMTPEDLKKAGEIRAKYGPNLVLYLGRLSWYKGLDVLMDAAAVTKARLLVVGGLPLPPMKKLARKNNMEERVFFQGPVEKTAPYLQACDLLVLPSTSPAESFGTVILEAMAAGKPVISTELGTGTSWVNQHGETGLVIPPGNAQALSSAIRLLLKSPTLRKKMGERGRKRARLFTRDRMAESHFRLYEKLTSSPRGEARPSAEKRFR